MIKANAETLEKANDKYNVAIDEEGHTLLDAENPEAVGERLLNAYQAIQDNGVLLADSTAKADIFSAEAIQSVTAVQAQLADLDTAISNEMRWLSRKVTRPVVSSSLGTGGYVANELRDKVDAAIAALSPEI